MQRAEIHWRPWLMLALLGLSAPLATADSGLVFDNSTAIPVDNVPMKPTLFTLGDSRRVTRIQTFHWNGGNGAAPGSIALQGRDKALLGPWKAKGVPDERGVENAYWEVTPDIVLEAGTYTVLDSDPATWGRNPEQGNVGIVRIYADAGVPERTVPAASADAAPATSAVPALKQQQALATTLFAEIGATDRYDFERIEQLYLQVIRECPDTDQAEESYFRLSNLYRMGYDPPKYESLRLLLEEFLQLYPESEGAPEMRERLLRAYENSGRWEAVVALYQEIVPALPEDHPYLLVTHLDYARALEGAGERGRAFAIYEKVAAIASGKNAHRYDMSDLWLRAARDRIGAIGMIEQGKWHDLVAVYREQFGNMAWAEMPHIQELLEYAEALEKTGDIAAAIKQYRQVLTTDQGYATRQAGMARERLAALGG